MKNQFPEYYRPTVEEFSQKFKECIFVFDTNVLLNLYRYTTESRDNLIEVLQTIKERVWLPHQVGLEYQRNRVEVLLSQLGLSAKLDGMISNTIETVEKLNRSNLFSVNALIEAVNTDLAAIKKKLQQKKEQKPDLMTGDPIFDAITQIFDGKVGNPYNPEEYINIYKKGKARYEAEIPPGYKDKSKDPNDTNQYGDFLVWLQLIDYAKSVDEPIILVTDDAKEDWWRDDRGEKLGPRAELLKEHRDETGGNKWFYMYSTEQFLKHAKEYLNMDVTTKVIEEAEEIEKEDAEQEKIRISITDWKNSSSVLDDYIKRSSALEELKIQSSVLDDYMQHSSGLDELKIHSSAFDDYKKQSSAFDEYKKLSGALEDYKKQYSALDDYKKHSSVLDELMKLRCTLDRFNK